MLNKINELNDGQSRAMTAAQGPVLVIAGPGTGKTMTIVRRIAHLVNEGAKPETILALTFTNRAAREMKERISALLGEPASRILIGTFHVLGLKIIRETFGDNFSIYDRDEQVELLKSLIKGTTKQAVQAADRISRIKNFPDEVAAPEIKEIHAAYQAALHERNAYDFDDLIRVPLDILARSGGAWSDRFRYLIIDEYQDINAVQYRFIKHLLKSNNNIWAVGDPDQAIYAFRGADLGNFLNFERDFPGAKQIILSLNYRSTDSIVKASTSVIEHNQKRMKKELAATQDSGRPVTVISVPDERTEGAAIIAEIEERMGGTSHYRMTRARPGRDMNGPCRFSDFAVIYRTNAQVKALADAFSSSGIPYQIIGRKNAAQARELEETIAFLRSFLQETEPLTLHATGPESKLITSDDYFDPRADAVTLMTMHAAKGLEFPVVFIAGCEQGILPCTVMKDDVDIEEERRLFYVGMTRAKEELILLHARRRFLYGESLVQQPSPFLGEIPEALKETRLIADKLRKEKPEDKQMGLF
jgi:superfamily I DNA/RNA helicase